MTAPIQPTSLALRALLDRDLAALQVLLREHPVTLHARFFGGATLLHVAAARGYVGETCTLLDAGAAVNTTTDAGETPLFQAARHGHLDVVRVLLHERADATALTEAGQSALDVAVEAGHDAVCIAILNAGGRLGGRHG